ncbi:deoxyribonuclease-2-alpha-like [Cheilinus undulatus]|uniref:deoxyribonuclease-2-alpha-like n=1 Tax=Cheilinus undulatus TaxID=241271 RepID=UPI001BD6B7FD|nr:deoxyribonuclease-2-alpha-like [Cheilinus undulatus]
MWRSVLVLSLLCWGTDGAVTCKDARNNAVPWYILYKAPSLQAKYLTGLEYLYIDSTTSTDVDPQRYNNIADRNGVLANTLQPMFTPIRSMPATFGFISYSDQPPGSRASDKFGHSKGVLMMDKTSTGVWLFHSTPQFPFRRDRDHFWPDSGTTNAQIFLCVTFPYSEFSKIGTHLQYIRAYPFEHDLPADFHQELRDAVNWVSAQPSNNFMTLMSTDPFQRFSSIAKRTSEQPKDGDLYVTLAQRLNSDVHV